MEFDKETRGDVLVVRLLEKNVSSHEAPELKTALLGFLMGNEKKILLNLKGVKNMDSTGLGALLFGIRQAQRYGKDIRFSDAQAKVQFLIRIAQLQNVITMYKTEKVALKSFGADRTDEMPVP